jgi:tRNA modification GTPase
MSDTIVALATPLGRSGIGTVRISGRRALAVANDLAGYNILDIEPRAATLTPLVIPTTGDVIDEAIVIYFKGPRSFTGEDVVEISCHGSPIVLRQVIDSCLKLGARMAEPGEFSLRALANGRMDLAEAESIRDLINAQTVTTARQAVRQLRGEFSHQLQPIKDRLLDLIVILESAIEFVEDDLPPSETEKITSVLNELNAAVATIAATYQAGHLLREGLKVAIIGRPNVGKSSLFNALVGIDRAIVTDIAGTTRDQLHEQFTIGDLPISLIDTAGLRETTDTVESIGVDRSRRTMADADLVIVVLDASEIGSGGDRDILDSVRELEHLIVINKIDKIDGSADRASFPSDALPVSARTGAGLKELKEAIVGPITAGVDTSGFLVSDARHHDLLVRASSELRAALELIESQTSEEIVLVHLHNALRYLGEITGETTTEDMLTRIFSTFCIGK